MSKATAAADNDLPGTLVQQALKDCGVLNPDDNSSQPVDRLLALTGDVAKTDALLDTIFPEGIPRDAAFYDVLDELWKWVNFGDKFDQAVGRLWAKALQRLEPASREQLLAVFAEDRRHDLFMLLGCLPTVMEEVSVDTHFLQEWLIKLYSRVQSDGANGGFWNAVKVLCRTNAAQALDLLSGMLKQAVPEANQFASALLGIVRGFALKADEQADLNRIESMLETATKLEHQKCWMFSWVATAKEHGLSVDQLDRLLAFGGTQTEHDIDTKLCTVCRLLTIERLNSAAFVKAFQWASDRVGPVISRNAKANIADAARALQWVLKHKSVYEIHGLQPAAWSTWITAMQPVDVEDLGTWGYIERYLVELLAADKPLFYSVFSALAEANGDDLLSVMRRPQCFDWLLRKMKEAHLDDLAATLLLSRNNSSRRVGLRLFDELGMESINPAILAHADERGVQLLFFEMQRSLLDPKTSARLFVTLLPRAEAIGGEFLSEFTNEISLQIQNFPGGCREELKRLAGDVSPIKELLADSEAYFAAHRSAAEAAIRGMQVRGTRRAAILHARGMSRQISSGMEEHSVLLKMVKKVQLIYGRTTSSYFDGNLQNAMPLVQQSSSFELPFVDYADPEMMAVRRLRAATAIQALQK